MHTDNGAEAEERRNLEHEKESLWEAWKHSAFQNRICTASW